MINGKWIKIRKNIGIADLAIGLLFLSMILTSEGGITENTRMMSVSWIFIWCGLLNFFGRSKKWTTIASIVFYSFGVLINIAYSIEYTAHFFLLLITLAFLTLICLSLLHKKATENDSNDDFNSQKTNVFGVVALTLGIIGMVSSCLFVGIFPSAIGVVFGILGMCQKNKSKGTAIAGTVCSGIGIFIFALFLIVANSSESAVEEKQHQEGLQEQLSELNEENEAEKEATPTEEPKEISEPTEEPTENLAATPTPEPTTTQEPTQEHTPTPEPNENIFEYADIEMVYLKSEIGYNEYDEKCLFVYFQMTNNSSENQSFDYLVDVKVFQDGIELETNYMYDCEEERNSGKEIKPEATITVAEVFEIGDSNDNLELEVRPFNIWSNRLLFEKSVILE